MPDARWRASRSSSWKLPSSRRYSTRSRAVILPRECCFSTASAEPAWRASVLGPASSARRSRMGCSVTAAGYRGPRRGLHVPAGHDLAVPAEPTPSVWVMPDPAATAETDLVAVGADLEPGTLLAAYRSGMFPMPVEGTLGWWSPDPRGILPLDGLRVSRSLRKACGRFEVRVDTAFDEVVTACADPGRTGGWISDAIRGA